MKALHILLLLAGVVLVTTPMRATDAAPQEHRGRVHLAGRALADDGGPFPALGVTLFWALWGEARDPDRLDRNLTWLAARGVDYVRILAMVGGESWEDRTIAPGDPAYWQTVDGLIARLGRHGLRAHVTLFAGAQVMMPDPAARARFVARWTERVNRETDRFVLIEIANEHYQNGLDDVAELRALAKQVATGTDVLVAISAAAAGQDCALYDRSAADVATVHYGRSTDGREGPWGPVLEPWDYPDARDGACRGRLPVAVNNEPIGPQSSVAADADPLRLVLAYVTTFVSGNASYVLHAGAGIRGGGAADRARGRSANFSEVSTLAEALEGIRAARARLPADLANWTRAAVDDPGLALNGVAAAIEKGDIISARTTTRQGRFVTVLVGVRRPLTLTANRDVAFVVLDPLKGSVVQDLHLRTGQTFNLAPRPRDEWGDALILVN